MTMTKVSLTLGSLLLVLIGYDGHQFPEIDMSVPEIIRYWGYPVETHKVLTKDGYILQMHRIPHGKENATVTKKKEAFYLQHPLLSSSADWVINLPNQSFGFILADRGYDVWLGNVRGNVYSKNHTTLKVKSKEFWNFSLDEFSKYDMPAMIDYILKTTQQSKLYYVGHSQGSMMGFSALSEDTALQKKVKVFFAMAPVTRMVHVSHLFTRMAAWKNQFAFVCRLIGKHEIFPSSRQAKMFMVRLCYWVPRLCNLISTMLSGGHSAHVNKTRYTIIFSHMPAGTSVKNLMHYFQLINSKLFGKFDYGKEGNMVHYKSKIPPEYNITNIKVPTVLVTGSKDTVAPPLDVKWTLSQLPNVKEHIAIEGYNHVDMLWAMNAANVTYERMIQIARTV